MLISKKQTRARDREREKRRLGGRPREWKEEIKEENCAENNWSSDFRTLLRLSPCKLSKNPIKQFLNTYTHILKQRDCIMFWF